MKHFNFRKLVVLSCLLLPALSSWAYELVIPEGTTEITYEDGYHDDVEITSVVIPNSVTSIGDYAFQGCTGLTSVTIPNGVTYIGISTFRGCSSLTSVTIPNGVTSIGFSTFRDCSSLTSVTIPNGVTYIGEGAFNACTGLTEITIPNSVTSIGDYAFPNFQIDVIFTGTLAEWVSASRYDFRQLYSSNIFVEGKNLSEMTDITIPDGVTEIGAYSLDFTNLTSVTIPNSVKEIREWAFGYTDGLEEVVFTGTLAEWVSIDRSDFLLGHWDQINNYTVYPNIFVEGKNLRELTEITIPANVQAVSRNAFSLCTNLKKVTCLAKVPPVAEYDATFGNYNAYLYIPCDNQEDYDLHQVWGKFKYIKCIEASQTDVALTDVAIEPGEQNANFAWPATENANTYSLTISKDGEVFCTLIFNANGQLTSIDFSGLKSASTGFQFNVTGLKEGSEYTYSLQAKDKSNKVLESYTGSFQTLKAGNAVADVKSLSNAITVLDGTILVNADATEVVSIYNAQGQCLFSQMGVVSFQTPAAGIYLVRCNDQVAKVLVK